LVFTGELQAWDVPTIKVVKIGQTRINVFEGTFQAAKKAGVILDLNQGTITSPGDGKVVDLTAQGKGRWVNLWYDSMSFNPTIYFSENRNIFMSYRNSRLVNVIRDHQCE